ncbi:type III secretion system chaperone [Photorhabdus namnaonensis]|uniref:DspF/AvrF protein n=1 Tax=Photorhabdus namnaonensis TaxID=1851568 RepID=A0A1B8YI81_9GAMM|nr:type III secretion system chaperone [Photorhabdus namnaonensis]OCA54842.1 DspF/AvrF protein [Photorhabdus namnaonensis]
MSKLEKLCADFAAQTNIMLNLSTGAVQLNIGDYGPWWLEVDSTRTTLTFHHTVASFVNSDAEFWLSLNSNINMLGGAWLALHQPTQTIRLCLLQDIERIDATDLANILGNLQKIRAELPFPETKPTTSASANDIFV